MKIDINLIIGSGITLISIWVGIFIKYWLDIRQQKKSYKVHASNMLFNKQIEFCEKIVIILFEAYSAVGDFEKEMVGRRNFDIHEDKRVVEAFLECFDVFKNFQTFLPNELCDKINEFFSLYFSSNKSVDKSKTSLLKNKIFELQETLRDFLGVDKISAEFLNILGMEKLQKNKLLGKKSI